MTCQSPNSKHGECVESICGGMGDYYGPCGGCCGCLSYCAWEGHFEQVAQPISTLTGQPCKHAYDMRCVECVGDDEFQVDPPKGAP